MEAYKGIEFNSGKARLKAFHIFSADRLYTLTMKKKSRSTNAPAVMINNQSDLYLRWFLDEKEREM